MTVGTVSLLRLSERNRTIGSATDTSNPQPVVLLYEISQAERVRVDSAVAGARSRQATEAAFKRSTGHPTARQHSISYRLRFQILGHICGV